MQIKKRIFVLTGRLENVGISERRIMVIINLIDYNDCKHPVDIGDLDNIKIMAIHVVTGDEILYVLYKDDTEKVFDSSDDRMEDFYDGTYPIYAFGHWLIDKDKFINRKTSYDLLNSETMYKCMEELHKSEKVLFEQIEKVYGQRSDN